MKIVYLGDNRIRGNYGCRGTSTALSQLIGKNNQIVGRITGNVTETFPRIFYFKFFPRCLYNLIGKWNKWNKIQPIASRFVFWLGRKLHKESWFDFVSYDMDKSIKNLRKCLPANALLQELDLDKYEFDAVVVNGEGSFIFTTPQWREPLVMSMIMYWAQKLGKEVYFLNAMFSDRPNNPRNTKTLELVNGILSKCKIVVAREVISYNYVKENLPNVKPILIPDALFTWYDLINDNHKVTDGKYYLSHDSESDEAYINLDFTRKYILVSGSSAPIIGENKNAAIDSFSKLIDKLKLNYNGNVFLIQVCEGDAFLKDVSLITNTPILSLTTPLIAAAKILANAEVYISGRYHPAIMASLGGTPCVFMGSNSHKTWSLQKLLNYENVKEFNAIPTDKDITDIIDSAIKLIDNESMRQKIKSRAKELSDKAKTIEKLVK